MQIDRLILGDFQTNCYVLRESPQPGECLIIDPGLGAEVLLDFLQREQLQPRKVLLTHGHGDHIAGIPLLRAKYDGLAVLISRDDEAALDDEQLNLSAMMGRPMTFGPAQRTVQGGDVLEFGQIELKVLATPGHTPGGVSYYCVAQAAVFTGDSLFAESIGRHDFPGGDLEQLLAGIRAELFTLGDETKVYPGHGPVTSIGRERHSNPFFP